MREILTVALVATACATTQATTTRAPVAPEQGDAHRLAAELEDDLANAPRVPPEPTPPEPIWSGFMIVEFFDDTNHPPAVVILFEKPTGLLDDEVFANGVRLTSVRDGDGWWYPVTRGGIVFDSVRASYTSGVTAEIPADGATLTVATHRDDPNLTQGWVPCSQRVCGAVYKAVANQIVSCTGPRCAGALWP